MYGTTKSNKSANDVELDEVTKSDEESVYVVRKEVEESLNKEIINSYQFSKGKDASKGKVHSRYHYMEIHQGNEEPKIKLDFHPTRPRKRNHDEGTLQGELGKLKPPTLDGEMFGEVVEIWLREMKNYLQMHDYFDNQEV